MATTFTTRCGTCHATTGGGSFCLDIAACDERAAAGRAARAAFENPTCACGAPATTRAAGRDVCRACKAAAR